MTTVTETTVVQGWTTIIGKLLSGDLSYAPTVLYIEYENVADPNTEIAKPTVDTADGVEYYDGLVNLANKDYLRIPMLQTPLLTADTVTFFAQSSGTVGVHGRPFAAGNNSKVYGAALIAAPTPNDPTQDIVLARTYFGTNEQTVKTPSANVSINWPLALTL